MAFKQVQWSYFFPIMMFVLVFCISKEIANYKTKKETSNNFFRFICFSHEPLPLVSVILIIIDYVFLCVIIALNLISLFLPEDSVAVLVLISYIFSLTFSGVAGAISHYIKKHNEDNI